VDFVRVGSTGYDAVDAIFTVRYVIIAAKCVQYVVEGQFVRIVHRNVVIVDATGYVLTAVTGIYVMGATVEIVTIQRLK